MPIELILDDSAAAFGGSWTNYSGSLWQNYGGSVRYNGAGNGSEYATFRPNLPAVGTYEVFIWLDQFSGGASNMPVYISYAGGSETQTFNIKTIPNNVGWVSLGTFFFDAGTSGYVEVSDDADNMVFADAVKWVQLSTQTPTPSSTPSDTPTPTDTLAPSVTPTASDTPTPSDTPVASNTPSATATSAGGSMVNYIVDDQDSGYFQEGSWTTFTNSSFYDFYASSVRYKSGGNGSATASFTPNLPEAGEYEVFAWIDRYNNGATNQPFSIYYNGGNITVNLNVTSAPSNGGWVSLGSYNFLAGTAGYVITNDNANGDVVADAVRWYKAGAPTAVPTATNTSIAPDIVIVDNSDGGPMVSISGSWNSANNGYFGISSYGPNFRYKAAGDGSATVTYQPNMPKTASYEVFIWINQSNYGATNMRVEVNHAGGLNAVYVNIKNAPFSNGGWVNLGSYTFNTGTGGNVVVTDQASGGYVMADAIRWVEVP